MADPGNLPVSQAQQRLRFVLRADAAAAAQKSLPTERVCARILWNLISNACEVYSAGRDGAGAL